MKIQNKILLLLILLMLPCSLFAMTGKVYDNLTVESKILEMERKFALYLPPDYETSERSYPVLYLLHGGGDDQTGWVQFGEVLHITDKAIRDGIATPMIIVMPDADTKHRGYANDLSGEWRYEDFFFQELMPYVEKTWRIKSEKRYRAVAGLSMGGFGTFSFALHRPYLFSSACPLSASTGPLDIDALKARAKRYSYNQDKTYSEKELTEYLHTYSSVYMMRNMPEDSIKSVRWYMDCGDDDFLYEGNSLIHITMRKRELPHEFRIRDGNHNWTYWRQALPDVLRFVSDAFHQH